MLTSMPIQMVIIFLFITSHSKHLSFKRFFFINLDNLNDTTGVDSTTTGGVDSNQTASNQSHSNYRYDLILFPRILDICLTFIQESNHKPDVKPAIEIFFKRLLYLLETCNFNIQILINNVSLTFYISQNCLALIILISTIINQFRIFDLISSTCCRPQHSR